MGILEEANTMFLLSKPYSWNYYKLVGARSFACLFEPLGDDFYETMKHVVNEIFLNLN